VLAQAINALNQATSIQELGEVLDEVLTPFKIYKNTLFDLVQKAEVEELKQQTSRYHFSQMLLNELNTAYLRQEDTILHDLRLAQKKNDNEK